jgi:serine phosphatase RsbU (regulator of sigma subunit)
LPSAFITVFLKSLFDQYRERFRQGNDRILLDPAGLLDTLNMRILDQQINKHLTLFYGIIEPAPGLLHYANGGQFPFPLLITPDSTACLEKNSPPLGLFPNVAYETVHITLPPACRILIPSDGILELLAGESLADKEALLTELVRGEENPAETLCRTLHLDERPVLPDDVTILSIKRGAVWNPASTSMPGTTTSVS